MVARWLAAAVVLVIAVTTGAARARAGEDDLAVALLLDRPGRAEIGRELLVALAERHARVIAGDAPVGDTPFVRAALAQRQARDLGAVVARGGGGGRRRPDALHAVLVDGHELRRALLPGPVEALEPRVVATVAASLIDELPAGPQGSITVTISVGEPARRAALDVEDDPPGTSPLPRLEPAPPHPGTWELIGGSSVELRGLASLEGRVIWRSHAGLGVGAWVTYGHVLADGSWSSTMFGGELSRSLGTGVRFDYGVTAGLALHARENWGMGGVPLALDPDVRPDGDWSSLVGGGKAALMGGRLGVALPLSPALALRLDVTGVGMTSAVHGISLCSWVSLLAEWRL